MIPIQKPCVAGTFYPEDPAVLEAQVNMLIANAHPSITEPPKALIAPHAGYIYSGPIAGSIYATLQKNRDAIQRVVLLGPAHRLPFQGIATTPMHTFLTPLGSIPVDHHSIQKALKVPCVGMLEEAFMGEHCLEVQLPFLQRLLNRFEIVPFVVGDVAPRTVAQLVETLWGGEETLIVVSSDLSHYHDYKTAQIMDEATSLAIADLAPEKIHPDQACGRLPIQGLLLAAKTHQLQAKILDVRNSGDTAGSKDQVVGYGAYHFS